MKTASHKDVVVWPLAALLTLALFLQTGCSGDGSDETTESQTPVEQPAEEAMGEEACGPADHTEAPAEAAPQERDLDQVAQERLLEQQKKDLLVQHYLNLAEQQIAANQLERAEETIILALGERPTDAKALDLLRHVRVMRGSPVETDAELSIFVINKRRAFRQKQVALVRDHWVKAMQARENNDLEGAKKQLTQAQLLIKFDPYETDFTDPELGDLGARVEEELRTVTNLVAQERREREIDDFGEAYEKIRSEEAKRQKRRAEEIRLLMVEGVKAFERRDFDSTENLARKVIRLEPGFTKAHELLDAARKARHVAWRSAFYKQRREQWQNWLEDVRHSQIPFTDVLRWTDLGKWEKISNLRRRGDAIDVALEDSEAIKEIKAKLANESVTWNFGEGETETTLLQAIDAIRNTRGINIVVDKEVESDKGENAVNLTLNNHNLGSALSILLEAQELAYTFDNNVLKITSREKASGKPLPRIYEIRDLTIKLANFKAPDLSLRAGGTGEAAKAAIWGEDLEATETENPDGLLDLIRQNVKPAHGEWDENGHTLIVSAQQLVATTTPKVHQQIEDFLHDLRQFTKLVVHVEARFISITKAELTEVGFDFRGLGAGGAANPGTVALLDDVTNDSIQQTSAGLDNSGPGLPAAASLSPSSGAYFNDGSDGDARARTEHLFDRAVGSILNGRGGATVAFTLLDDLEVTGLLRAVEQSANATLVNAPRLTIYNNQRANLTLVNQVSYVKDYDVEVAQTAFIADPLVDVIQDGLTLEVRPTISHDRRYVTMEVHPTVANLIRPIRTFETTLSGLTTPVVIELPEVTVQEAATTVKVPDGGYLAIGGFKRLSTIDRRSETPILSNIPIVSFFFSRKGRSDELRDLIIVMNVRIVDLTEREADLVN